MPRASCLRLLAPLKAIARIALPGFLEEGPAAQDGSHGPSYAKLWDSPAAQKGKLPSGSVFHPAAPGAESRQP